MLAIPSESSILLYLDQWIIGAVTNGFVRIQLEATQKEEELMTTLFERIGGEAAIDAAVEKFYEKVLSDDRIKHFFEGVDMDRQIIHQKRFFTYALGNLPEYTGKNIRDAHKHLVDEMGLSDKHFDAVLENLGAVLGELRVPHILLTEALEVVESVRDDVLSR